MKPGLRLPLVASGLVLACVVALLIVPVPPVANTTSVDSLAGPSGRFVQVEARRLYTESAGSDRPLIVLLHGFGASSFSWRDVLEPLAAFGRAVAYDRTGFGLSDRPMPGEWEGPTPYSTDYQADLLPDLIEALGEKDAVLIGNSAGGTVAILAALEHPERVRALVLVSAAVYIHGGIPAWVKPIFAAPPLRRIGPILVRSIATEGDSTIRRAWHDPSRISPERIAGYRLPLRAENWDRALFEVTLAPSPAPLAGRLGELRLPVLIVTGDDDRIVPTAESLRLATEIPGARLAVLPECGHLPQEECPDSFLAAVGSFLEDLPSPDPTTAAAGPSRRPRPRPPLATAAAGTPGSSPYHRQRRPIRSRPRLQRGRGVPG